MASIFKVWSQKEKWKKNNQIKWQTKTEHVRNGEWKNEQKVIKKIEENEFGDGIEENNGIKIEIQKPAAVKKHWSDCVKKNKNFKHYVDKKNKNLMFMLPAFCKKKKKSDDGGDVIDHVETKHKKTMQKVGDWLLEVKEQKTAGQNQHGISDTGSNVREWIHNIYELIEEPATVRLDYNK